MIRTIAFLSCASLAVLLAGCPSNGDSSGAGGSGANSGSGANGGSGGNGGSGDTCTATGTCGAPFVAPEAGSPSADCKDNVELAGIPDGTVLKKACSPYHVKGVAVAQGSLTIEAGVHVQLATDAHFDVAGKAHVDAEGTACDPIVFEPDPESSAFGHVNIGSTAPDKDQSILRYVEFRHGASNNATLDPSDGVLFLTGTTPVLLDHVNIIGSKHFGLAMTHGQHLADGSTDIFIDETPDGPAVMADTESLSTLPTLLVGCNVPKAPKGILVENGGVAHDMTFGTQNVPLVFNTNLSVSPTQVETLLTIAAPNTLLFNKDTGISVGGNGNTAANLVASGDITFDAKDPVVGWRGIYLHGTVDEKTVLQGGRMENAATWEAFGAKDGKQAFGAILITLSQTMPAAWPKIEGFTVEHVQKAPAGVNKESACLFVGQPSPGSAPKYDDPMLKNTLKDCDVPIAYSN